MFVTLYYIKNGTVDMHKVLSRGMKFWYLNNIWSLWALYNSVFTWAGPGGQESWILSWVQLLIISVQSMFYCNNNHTGWQAGPERSWMLLCEESLPGKTASTVQCSLGHPVSVWKKNKKWHGKTLYEKHNNFFLIYIRLDCIQDM